MKVISFIYHDVVANGRYDESGFPGAGPARYKLSPENFELHLNELERGTKHAPVIVGELERQPVEVPWLLTFDDGGASSVWIGENLAQRDWRGHFFITVDWIGKPGFVDKDGIRGLESMGHVIGSHSCSHPEQMARCSRDELLYEWGRSTEVLSEIIGRPVDLASVPGGYYSPLVAETAAAVGIRVLFNSEPVISSHAIDGCLVLGRFPVFRGTSPRTVVGLACAKRVPLARQFAYWNAKRAAKAVGGKRYVQFRRWILAKL